MEISVPRWADLNPFARADRGQVSDPNPPNKNQVIDDPNKDRNDLITEDPNKKKEADDPLLKFDSLWHPNVDKDGKPIVEDKTPKPYLPAVDETKLNAMVAKMDFTRDISPEEWKAVSEGGENGIAAIASILNKVSRKSFLTAFQASSKLTEQGFHTAKERFTGEVPEHVRDLILDSELSADPIMKNPAFSPIVKTVKEQYLRKFPKASPAELNNAVKQYFQFLGKELNTPNKNQQTQETDNAAKLRRGAPDSDFFEWLGQEVNVPGEGGETQTQQ